MKKKKEKKKPQSHTQTLGDPFGDVGLLVVASHRRNVLRVFGLIKKNKKNVWRQQSRMQHSALKWG